MPRLLRPFLPPLHLGLLALLLRLRLRDNVVRLRRRVSSTVLTPKLPGPFFHPYDSFPPAVIPTPSTPLTRYRPHLVFFFIALLFSSLLFSASVTLSLEFHFRRPPTIPPDSRFPRPPLYRHPLDISAVAHPRFFRPDLFERQNVLGTLIPRESEREGRWERKTEWGRK